MILILIELKINLLFNWVPRIGFRTARKRSKEIDMMINVSDVSMMVNKGLKKRGFIRQYVLLLFGSFVENCMIIRTMKIVNSSGIPWAKRKYKEKLLKLDLLHLQL